ncbi:class I SAM-dependent methyltransferase [Dyella lipolytica]|uniref:Class I SAM-dependent methyltransferase n=1 Tax=Dyella lipolytica TaxID=1867835 RepID=A0ABW8IWI7_9GAMM|nr:class I SAM-dependent methyltransferase [Dyella lipolytica]
MLNWFADASEYVAAVNDLRSTVIADEDSLAKSTSVQGWCAWCDRATIFSVSEGGAFSDRPNLREGMRCAHCRLTNRQRLVGCAVAENVPGREARIALLEQTSRLYRSVKKRYPNTMGSEFLGPDKQHGKAYVWRSSTFRPRYTRHEDITQLSYASNSLDLIAHSDVMEHVYDYRAALRECSRVLAPGSTLVFTVPFFHENATSLLRGKPNSDGSLTHFAPPEYHGDGLNRTGIYTFHSFGLDLIDELRAAGFTHVSIGLCYAPSYGFVSANTAVFRAIK